MYASGRFCYFCVESIIAHEALRKLLKMCKSKQRKNTLHKHLLHPPTPGGHGNSPAAPDAFTVGWANLAECKQKKACVALQLN